MTYRLNDVYTAIADRTRRQILEYLSADELSATEIANKFELSRVAISKHLRVLRQTKLVNMRQSGRNRFYRINAEPLRQVHDWVRRYEKFWDDRLLSLKRQVEDGK